MAKRLSAFLFALFLVLITPSVVSASAECEFRLGFKTLRDLIGHDIVGACLENEHYNAIGDSNQRTTGGLMAWRKADNWTAFTDGYRTWINGPNGLVQRLNTERFAWEADYAEVVLRPAALTISYAELFRNNEKYTGQLLYFRGEVVQVLERGVNTYDMRVDVGQNEGIVYLARYSGKRLLEDDVIEIFGESVGLVTYTAIFGNEITIPALQAVWVGLAQGAATPEGSAGSPAGLSLENPVAAGDVLVGSDGVGIRVTGITPNAWLQIQRENSFNDPPAAGKHFFMISVEVGNPPDAESSVNVSESDFRLIGDNRVVYEPFDESCGVIPDELDGEIFGGGRLEGNICFEVPANEGGFILIHAPGYSSDSRRFLSLQ